MSMLETNQKMANSRVIESFNEDIRNQNNKMEILGLKRQTKYSVEGLSGRMEGQMKESVN